MSKRLRAKYVAAALCCGTMLQLGGCLSAATTSLLAAIDFCAVLGADCTLGPFAPCGDPTTADDDLLVDCPAPIDNGG